MGHGSKLTIPNLGKLSSRNHCFLQHFEASAERIAESEDLHEAVGDSDSEGILCERSHSPFDSRQRSTSAWPQMCSGWYPFLVTLDMSERMRLTFWGIWVNGRILLNLLSILVSWQMGELAKQRLLFIYIFGQLIGQSCRQLCCFAGQMARVAREA